MTHNPGKGFQGKMLQMLQEAVPTISRLGVLRVPQTPSTMLESEERVIKGWQVTAQKLGLTAIVVSVEHIDDYAEAFATLTREGIDTMYVYSNPLNVSNKKRITDFALKHRFPIVSNSVNILRSGGLLRYYTD